MLYFADKNFSITEINPFTKQTYDSSWLIYMLTDETDYDFFVGNNNGFVYCIKASRKNSDWKMSLGDFLDFHKNKNIILVMDKSEYISSLSFYGLHKFNDRYLRTNEPKILVHSTTSDNWGKIKNDNCLKSYNFLENKSEAPIGDLLGDPIEFRDYIMFGTGGVSGEIVVASKENGKITMNTDTAYKTGARLYFDAEKIAKDGLLVRDGIHIKVKDKLLLEPYLLWTANWENIGLKSDISTPKEFSEKADEKFCEIYGDLL